LPLDEVPRACFGAWPLVIAAVPRTDRAMLRVYFVDKLVRN